MRRHIRAGHESSVEWLVAAAIGLSLGASSCASPQLIDVDGASIESPMMVAAVSDGWVAVDTLTAPARAVLELRAETPSPTAPPWDLAELELRLADGTGLAPSRLSCQEPRCCPTVAGTPCGEEQGEEAEAEGRPAGRHCVHVVRAEFVLSSVPGPRDSTWLRLGARTELLRWRRR